MRDEQRQQTRTSAGSIPFEFAISSILALTGTFEDLTSLFLFATWIFYALTIAAMIRMRRTEPALERPYRCWGYPWVPAVFLAGVAALTVTLWLARPVRSSVGLVLIFSGLLFYQHWRGKLPARSSFVRSNQPAAATRASNASDSNGRIGFCFPAWIAPPRILNPTARRGPGREK